MDANALYELLWDFAKARVVTVAAKCGILQHLAREPGSAEQVATELGLDALATAKMLRALCALEIVDAVWDRYRLASGLIPHFTPGQADLTPFVEHSHALFDRWGATLEDWVRTGAQARPARTPEQTEKFGRGMWASASLIAPQVYTALDNFAGVASMLDIGGGIGGYAAAFCRRKPDLQATVLDVPEVAALGERIHRGTDLEKRIHFRAGDYHDADLGGGYDFVLLANVLHIEPAAAAAALVKRAVAALRVGGCCAVVDFAIDDEQRRNVLGCLFSINMRSHGDTHTGPSISNWLAASAADAIRCVDLPPAHWLICGQRVR